MSTLTITLIQADLQWHDAAANRNAFRAAIDDIDGDTDLILLPEMFTTGFSMDAPGLAETMDGESVRWMQRAAADRGAAVAGSLIIVERGRYLNRFVLAHADGRLDVYDKRHLFRLAGEGDHYDVGNAQVTLELNGWSIRPLVCYDLRFPVWSRRQRRQDFDLLLYVANWPSPRHHAWETLLRARAIENQCYVAGVNRTGRDGNDVPYSGGSAAIDYLGQDLVQLGASPGSATQTLDRAPLQKFRERFPFDVDADDFELRR